MEHKMNVTYSEARDFLIGKVQLPEKEKVSLSEAGLRILGEDIIANNSIPSFDKSPYDGYTFRAQDTENAPKEKPVIMKIVEEVPAGCVATKTVEKMKQPKS